MKKIILIRHAESYEDIDPNMHNSDDSEIGITVKGRKQSIELAEHLSLELANCSNVKVFHSSSRRVRDTTFFVLSQLRNKKFDITEIEYIRNLNWGNTNSKNVKNIVKQRYEKGVLFFRFPGGDNTPVFVNKICNFVSEEVMNESNSDCIVIFTHGFALRVVAKHILGVSDEKFRYLANPKNCFSVTLQKNKENIFIPNNPLPTVVL